MANRICMKCPEEVSADHEGRTKYCDAHLHFMKKRGWRFSDDGRMTRGKIEVTTPKNPTQKQVVTVKVGYNTRMIALMTGDITIADLDDEELSRGMCRDNTGKFPRAEAELVPRAMYDQMTRELFSRADATLRTGLTTATEYIVEMIGDTNIDAKIRLQAGQWLFERLRGKIPDVIQLTQEKPFEVLLTHVHRGPRAEPKPVELEVLDVEAEDDLTLG